MSAGAERHVFVTATLGGGGGASPLFRWARMTGGEIPPPKEAVRNWAPRVRLAPGGSGRGGFYRSPRLFPSTSYEKQALLRPSKFLPGQSARRFHPSLTLHLPAGSGARRGDHGA